MIYIYYMTLYDISDIYVDSSLISDISDVSVRGDPKASHASAERREAGGGNCFFQDEWFLSGRVVTGAPLL